jgi:DNA-binding transcriptional MerR regulator
VPDALPDKEFFKIGEAAKLVGVKPYVLRYWETEFKRDIRPERTRSNQRMYRRRDVETFLEIKRLRYEEKLELGGARKKLRAPPGAAASPVAGDDSLRAALRDGLEELLRIIDEDERGE